ncbi:MAG: hypothetical protein U1E45_10905 [Geminicoccaceae bacterium]
MFNMATVVAEAFAAYMADSYRSVYGERQSENADTIRAVAQLAVERLHSSDALYHDAEHTILVAQVGQSILRGRLMVDEVTPADWLHYTVATLLHDIGYLRGILPGDGAGRYVISETGETVEAPRGASDAFLTPWHIDRGKLFVRHRCKSIPGLDVERIASAIELTRFPVPDETEQTENASEAGLVRAADLIGQLSDPNHDRKYVALFAEFQETGVARQLGYSSPADIAEEYPQFFWSRVEPVIGPALAHLDRTTEGKQWVAQLYAHVFVEEHQRDRSGPER